MTGYFGESRLLPGDSAPLSVINTAAARCGEEIHSRGRRGPVRKETSPLQTKIQKPTGEFESVNMLSSVSGRGIDVVKGVRGVVKTGERRNQISFCVDKIRHHHFAIAF